MLEEAYVPLEALLPLGGKTEGFLLPIAKSLNRTGFGLGHGKTHT
jgi:hypothetical protein